MKVSELIEQLQAMPQDAKVGLAHPFKNQSEISYLRKPLYKVEHEPASAHDFTGRPEVILYYDVNK